MDDMKPTRCNDIGNYYGGLWIKMENGHPYWSIENRGGHDWQPCPPSVFASLAAEYATLPRIGDDNG